MYIGSPPTMSTSSEYYTQYGRCDFLEIDEDELDTSTLHARTIPLPCRDRLIPSVQPWFSPTPADLPGDHAGILAELSRLAPSVAKNFIPKSHAETAFTLRLINDVDFHGEEESYIAMSYCWKGIVWNTRRCVVTPVGDLPFGWQKQVEQFPLPTTSSLFNVVLRERRKHEGLWFDQVCINQDDEDERTTTVGAMDMIYKNARVVVVILDDIAVTPEEEQVLRYFFRQYSFLDAHHGQQPCTGMNPPLLHQYTSLRSFFERIISSIWFDRAWCAHEMRSAQNHVFLVPSDTNYGDGIQNIIRFDGSFFAHLLALASELHDAPYLSSSKFQSLLRVFRTKHITEDYAVRRPDTPHTPISEPMSSIPSSFMSTFHEVFRQNAGGNPKLPEYLRKLDGNRDKMSIALSACKLPLALAPTGPFSRPYIEDECLRSLLLVALAARDPLSLCTTGTPLRLHDGSVSWLCRPSELDTRSAQISTSTSLSRFSRDAASNIIHASDGQAEFAQLDLIFLDIPHRTHPNPYFTSHVARARLFIDLCIQYQVPGGGLWSFSRAPGHPRTPGLRNSFIQTLACIFECGSQWLLDMVSSLPQQYPSYFPLSSSSYSSFSSSPFHPYTLSMLFNPSFPLPTYLSQPDGFSTATHLLGIISTLIAVGIPWSSGASEHSHGPLIISCPSLSPISSSFTSSASSSSTSSSSPHHPHQHSPKALIFAPFTHSKTLLIAIPHPLSNPRYASLPRGWILTSTNPFTGRAPSPTTKKAGPIVSWTLQGKGVIFGETNFVHGVHGVGQVEEGKRWHRVYGPLGK